MEAGASFRVHFVYDQTAVSLRGVHYWTCDQGDEQQLASGLFLLRYLPGRARRRWIC